MAAFRCDACPALCRSALALRTHRKRHSPPVACARCRRSFSNDLQRLRHAKLAKCPAKRAPVKRPPRKAVEEKEGDDDEALNVSEDEEAGSSEDKASSASAQHRCDKCLGVYAGYKSLYQHRHYGARCGDKAATHECRRCGRQFTLKHSLVRHSTLPEACARELRRSAARLRLRLAPGDPLQCSRCGFEASSALLLQRHAAAPRACALRLGHVCDGCGQRLPSTRLLRRHRATSHLCRAVWIPALDERTTCDECAKTFASVFTLERHKKKCADLNKPRESKSFKCSGCNVILSCRVALERHARNPSACEQQRRNQEMVRQTDASGLRCLKCGKTYKTRVQLARHLTTSKSCSQSIPFACSDCGRTFSAKTSVERHQAGRSCPGTPRETTAPTRRSPGTIPSTPPRPSTFSSQRVAAAGSRGLVDLELDSDDE